MDDIRIYNRELSDAEISRLYQLGATTKVGKTITTNPDLENGLQGHWTFDGVDMDYNAAYEVLDKSPNGYDGDIDDGAGCDSNLSYNFVSGKIGQAFEASTSAVDCNIDVLGAHGNFSSTTMSATAWIYYEETDSNFGAFLSQGTGANGWIFTVCDSDPTECSSQPDTLQWYKYWGGADGSWHTDANTIPRREWTHVAVTYDRSDLSNDPVMYINGESMNVTEDLTPTGSTQLSLTGLEIGSFVAGSGAIYGGHIDDVRVYNRIISPEEVKRIYQLGSGN
jgi:hypothetical protein